MRWRSKNRWWWHRQKGRSEWKKERTSDLSSESRRLRLISNKKKRSLFTVWKIISNFGPNFSETRKMCKHRIYQRHRSRLMHILVKVDYSRTIGVDFQYFETWNAWLRTIKRVMNPIIQRVKATKSNIFHGSFLKNDQIVYRRRWVSNSVFQ